MPITGMPGKGPHLSFSICEIRNGVANPIIVRSGVDSDCDGLFLDGDGQIRPERGFAVP